MSRLEKIRQIRRRYAQESSDRKGMILFNGLEHSEHDQYFSNFAPSVIELDGIVYPTVEHAFQAHKSRLSNQREMIAKLGTPGQAKRAGRRAVTLRSDWEEVKYGHMVRCLRLKFAQEPFKTVLLDTGDKTIAEDASRWDDRIWGLGRSGNGENLLGKALMQVRSELKEEL